MTWTLLPWLLVALLSTRGFAISTHRAASFIADDQSLSFALNIPDENGSDELYFTLAGSKGLSWVAVGLGSNKMEGALVLMMYPDAGGKNITLSPRLSHGNVEPSYTTNVSITILPGTGLSDNIMIANAKCSNCRFWQDASISPNNSQADFIYAWSKDGTVKSDSLSAGIQRHDSHGTFQMDLHKAYGAGQVPVPFTAITTGTNQTSKESDNHYQQSAHAVLMVGVFYGALPSGVIILRILKSPKWHAVNQGISLLVAIVGASLGISLGTMYNRTKHAATAHQVIGVLVVIAMIGQFILGYTNHRAYTRTEAPTKLAKPHVWLGRFVIAGGILNAFFGFPLALSGKLNWVLLGLSIPLLGLYAFVVFWPKRKASKRKFLDTTELAQHPPPQYGPQYGGSKNPSVVNLSSIRTPPLSHGSVYQPAPSISQSPRSPRLYTTNDPWANASQLSLTAVQPREAF